jgi:hypothetical protein
VLAVTEYRKNRLVQIGFWLLVIGAGPLFGIILLAELGIWPDPNPNPIGPGLLFFFTFWPAVICLAIGVFQVRRKQRS